MSIIIKDLKPKHIVKPIDTVATSKPVRVSFIIDPSNHEHLKKLQEAYRNKEEKPVTRTSLINMILTNYFEEEGNTKRGGVI